ncbi:hypothetical protein MKZ38_006914 [Zalerion maritima]|uniref:Cyanovirin-N domain-containing protein n=1 Tax=Zalerion maritima TaxID=339359 RepID=A0AAD5S370_9PEZI|nr:hypothetical protein MKZ38_006914 [Zalerion maritima]
MLGQSIFTVLTTALLLVQAAWGQAPLLPRAAAADSEAINAHNDYHGFLSSCDVVFGYSQANHVINSPQLNVAASCKRSDSEARHLSCLDVASCVHIFTQENTLWPWFAFHGLHDIDDQAEDKKKYEPLSDRCSCYVSYEVAKEKGEPDTAPLRCSCIPDRDGTVWEYPTELLQLVINLNDLLGNVNGTLSCWGADKKEPVRGESLPLEGRLWAADSMNRPTDTSTSASSSTSKTTFATTYGIATPGSTKSKTETNGTAPTAESTSESTSESPPTET